MAHKALYRAYRPERFEDVIGQEHIITILKNQITSGRPSHAYLFCGTRGTGKTSTAKILSRALNCTELVDGEPCGKCDACTLDDAQCTDIVEIDAASNNSVENMRMLLDKARFAPLYLQKKVYIIDEVHMLSGSAFNALLKTLEEPPDHVVFILATTESQKLPATIISRCQRFDFRRISVANIVSRLEAVIKDVGVKIDKQGLIAIAHSADGGMRDALSLADQCIAFCGDDVTLKDVQSVLGNAPSEIMFNLAGELISGDMAKALTIFDSSLKSGHDISVLVSDAIDHFRALMVAMVCKDDAADILEITVDDMEAYLLQAKGTSLGRITRALDALLGCYAKLRLMPMPRVIVESAIVDICSPEREESLQALQDRMSALEKRVAQGVVAPDCAAANDARKPQKAAKAPTIAPVPEQSKQAETETAAKKPSADELWKKILLTIQKDKPTLYIVGKCADSVTLAGNVLTVRFNKKGYVTTMTSPASLTHLNNAITTAAPGTSLKITGQDDDADAVRQLFGDDVQIKE